MPFRPHLSTRPIRSLLHAASVAALPVPAARHAFHAAAALRDSSARSTHYETLDIPQTATAAEVKRAYFTLSKKYHPDHNPDDPSASARFVQISEAYHVLGVPDKRAQYDMQLGGSRGKGGRTHGPAHGSYSSHQTYAGSRPASGLNKKRSTFRGPPPSFYKAGGYGRHGAKRAEYAHYNPHAGAEKAADAGHEAPGPESYGDFGAGFGPGQTSHGNNVPHFDDARHKRTHDNVHEHIQKRRRGLRPEMPDLDPGGSFSSFLMIAGALTTIGLLAKALQLRLGDQPGRREGRSQ